MYVAIGMGLLRRSDILLSLDKSVRSVVDEIIRENGSEDIYFIQKTAYKRDAYIHPEDLETYLALRKERVFLGDLYVSLVNLEKTIHRMVKKLLQEHFGKDNEKWWKQAVPETVRIACVTSRERDRGNPVDPYCYTNFIHLKEIIDKNWSIFRKHLPPKESSDKRLLMQSLNRINSIRNKVMHPVRESPPTEEEFSFIHDMCSRLDVNFWRI